MAWHAKKSASGSKQWLKCAGSLALIAQLDPSMRRPTGIAAMTGTCAHALGETMLRHQVRTIDENEWLGQVIWLNAHEDAEFCGWRPDIDTPAQLSAELGQDVKFFTRVDEKMIAGVQLYLDVVWADFDEMGSTTEIAIEQRFDLSWLREGLGGTSDCTLWQYLGLLRVIDYKNGYVNVDAQDNTQGMIYALGEANRVNWEFEEVEVVIVQPNTRIGSPVKRFRLTAEELRAFQDVLAKGSDLVDEAFETLEKCEDQVDFNEWASTYLNAGTAEDHDQCTFCDAFATCPAANAVAAEAAMADFAEDPPSLNPVEVHDEQSLQRLTQLIKWGDYLDKLVKAAKTLGQRRLEQGLEMPGYKLVEGKTNRQWVNTDSEIATLLVAKGLPLEDLYEEPKPRALKSPAQMEKLGATRSAMRKQAKEAVADLAAKPPGKLTMAPESDPREAVTPGNASNDFVDDLPPEYEGDY